MKSLNTLAREYYETVGKMNLLKEEQYKLKEQLFKRLSYGDTKTKEYKLKKFKVEEVLIPAHVRSNYNQVLVFKIQ